MNIAEILAELEDLEVGGPAQTVNETGPDCLDLELLDGTAIRLDAFPDGTICYLVSIPNITMDDGGTVPAHLNAICYRLFKDWATVPSDNAFSVLPMEGGIF